MKAGVLGAGALDQPPSVPIFNLRTPVTGALHGRSSLRSPDRRSGPRSSWRWILNRGRRLGIAGLVGFAWIGLALPAEAADNKYKGFFLNLDFALTQPGGLDQHFATHVDSSSNPVQNERLVIDNDANSSYRGAVGYRLGRGLGSLQLSYWKYEGEDSQSDTLNGGVYPTIVGYTYGGGMYIYNPAGVTYTASSKVDASTWDFDYVRPIPISSGFTIKWIAGLRYAKYKENQSFLGNDGVSNFVQTKDFKSDAAGMRVGVAGLFDLSKHFAIEAGMAFSFMQATSEGLGTAIFPSGTIQMIKGSDDHVRGDIQDLDVRAVWRYKPVDYYIGYS